MNGKDAVIGFIAGGISILVVYMLIRKMKATYPALAQENEEVWTWKDWKGRERTITVHRRVKNG